MATKQAIAGVAPAETEEMTVMTHWPSIAQFGLGQALGKVFNIRWPNIYIFRLGNLFALLAIPLVVPLYFARLHPSVYGVSPHGVIYRLTNRRVQVLRNELHFDDTKVVRGVIVGLILAAVGFVLLPLLVMLVVAVVYGLAGWQFNAGEWSAVWTIAAIVGAIVGALKGFALGTFEFRFGQEVKSVRLDRFDAIDIEVQPGQEWYHAGDLVFRDGNVETFRLPAVVRPQAFRSTCMKAHSVYVGVLKATGREAVTS